ncbi:MAG: arsenite methyltransferase [Acidobacteria bacterium]|jgi:SAM-dependent methyltransferase|nr:arsenite methyltransferase [Acidobacteriota bacterium]
MTRVDETTQDAEGVVAEVRERYGRIAETAGSCCGPTTKASTCCGGDEAMSLQIGYGKKDLAGLPEGADLGLGCGAPVALLELKPGETVLDLGSGAGIDAFLAAREVGPSGRVIGVDMTPQMLARARRSAATTGHTNVEFREGRLEALPVEDGSVDAVTSNCVINLVPDKAAVFREVARVLKPGGRMVVADIVLDAPLPEAVVQDLSAWVGCISGAMRRDEYIDLVESSGLESVEALRDVDQGAAMEVAAPEQTRELLERTGTRREDLVGRVRSVTFRAVKPA